jgi:predicted transcriptional regulator
MKLYEISNQLRAVLDTGSDALTGELTEDAAKSIQWLSMDLKEKALGVAAYVLELQVECRAVALEEARLHARAAKLDSKAASLKAYLGKHIERELVPGDKWSDAVVTLSWRKADSVRITDLGSIPEHLIVRRTSEDANKPAIKDLLKGGVPVPGAELVTKQHLQIR